ncbi:hypothetical protein [Asanoa siamensis]|nr:hypothetical protein [Asanoa siamensis]
MAAVADPDGSVNDPGAGEGVYRGKEVDLRGRQVQYRPGCFAMA